MTDDRGEDTNLSTSKEGAKREYQCARCGKRATLRCASCPDIPTLDLTKNITTWYCNRDCPKIDWSEHKLVCKTIDLPPQSAVPVHI
jgi:hypothetical protein